MELVWGLGEADVGSGWKWKWCGSGWRCVGADEGVVKIGRAHV